MKYLLLAALLASPAAAQERRNVLETLSAALEADSAYEPSERAALMKAIKTRFADYGLQVVDKKREKAIPVVLHILTEGSFDQAPPERTAEVAFTAYQAMSRGSDPEVVEGVALYGYRKQISADTLSTWANGYRNLTDGKVPGDVAADLVRVAMEKDLKDSDFNSLKWSLIDGVKNGFDSKDYASYLFGNLLAGGKGPGRIASDAKAVFLKAKKTGVKPAIPDYKGVFTKVLPPPPAYTPPTAPPAVKPILDEVLKTSPKAQELQKKTTDALGKFGLGIPSMPKVVAPRPSGTPRVPAKPAPEPVEKSEAVAESGVSPKMKELWPGLEKASRSFLGTPYVWGGTTREGVDCSGLTMTTYGENRVKLPRVSRDQWKTGTKTESLREGDLLFFNTMGAGVSHVAMVVDPKARTFIHASSSKGVMIADLDNKWFGQRYLGARRVVP